MKRAVTSALALCLVLSLGGTVCLAAGGPVTLGEPLPLEFAELTISEVKLLDKLESAYSTQSGDGSSSTSASMTMAPPEGMKFFCLTGTVKNTDAAEYAVTNIAGEAVFDGKYTYPLFAKMALGGAFPSKLAPLTEGTIYICARIPDELAESFSAFSFTFGMEDSFAEPVPETAEECAHSFTFEGQWDGTAAAAAVEAADGAGAEETLAAGDVIDLDFVQMTLEEAGVKDDLLITSSASGISITSGQGPVEGKQYVYIQGKLKNLAKEAVRPRFAGSVELDGYRYELDASLAHEDATPASKIDPLDEVIFTLYAPVPAELTEVFQSGTIRFGFDGGFANNAFTEYEECAHRYLLELTAQE